MLKTIVKLGVRVATIAGMAYVTYHTGKVTYDIITEAIDRKVENDISDGMSTEEAGERIEDVSKFLVAGGMAGAVAVAGIIGLTMGATWRSDELAETKELLVHQARKLNGVSKWICNYSDWLTAFRQDRMDKSTNLDISQVERSKYLTDFATATLINDWFEALVMTPATKNGVVGAKYE